MFLQHFATLPLLCCCHICRLITPAPPMKSAPRSRAGSGRRSNPCRGLSCEHLDSPQHFHVPHILKIPQISHRPRGGGDLLRFCDPWLHFAYGVAFQFPTADYSLLCWTRTHHLVSNAEDQVLVYIEVHHSALQTM